MKLSNIFYMNINAIRNRYNGDNTLLDISDKITDYAINNDGESMIPYPTDEYATAWADNFKEQVVDRPFFIIGFSDGQFIRKLLNNTNGTNYIYVYEPDIYSFINVLNVYDMTDFIGSKRLIICVEGINEDGLFNIIHCAVHYGNYRKLLLCVLPGYGDFKQEYDKLYDMLSYRTEMVVMEKTTELQLVGHMRRNLLLNMKDVVSQRSINQLAEVAQNIDKTGYPAVIVSAGPSLDKNIHELKKAEKRAFIIVVDTALKAALRAGITPDLTVCVDPRKEIIFFKHDDVKNVPAVFEMDVPHEIIKDHIGNRFYVGNGELDVPGYYRQKLYGSDYSTLATGGSVANTAFSLAVMLGFKTIILIGQDLAFTGGRGHTKDAYDDERKNIMDAQEEMNCEVESIDGGMVKTEVRMRAYLKWFESNIISHPDVKVIDATEGGALIHGSIVMTLDEAINRECINQLDLKSVITGIEPQFSQAEQEEIYTYLERIEGELDRIRGLLDDGIKAYNRLGDALKSGNNELAKAELEKVGITNSLDKREPLFSLIRKYAVEERYRVNDELSRSDSDDSMAAVNSGIELLESYIKGIDKMKEDIHLLN